MNDTPYHTSRLMTRDAPGVTAAERLAVLSSRGRSGRVEVDGVAVAEGVTEGVTLGEDRWLADCVSVAVSEVDCDGVWVLVCEVVTVAACDCDCVVVTDGEGAHALRRPKRYIPG